MIPDRTGIMRGVPVTPHCSHIPPPFLAFWWEVSIRGLLRWGHGVRDLPGVSRNRLKQFA